jgi:RNA polymerase sigma-70 factor (ECF subfamily)
LHDKEQLARFDQVVLPHLDAAYNLARWLTRDEHDAADVVQEASLRAFQFFGGFRGGDARVWLLAIVRNTCYTWLERNRAREPAAAFDEARHSDPSASPRPEADLLRQEDRELLGRALDELPAEFREVIVLRELEGLSYKDIAAVTGCPLGTVMSRLARARERLESLVKRLHKEP